MLDLLGRALTSIILSLALLILWLHLWAEFKLHQQFPLWTEFFSRHARLRLLPLSLVAVLMICALLSIWIWFFQSVDFSVILSAREGLTTTIHYGTSPR